MLVSITNKSSKSMPAITTFNLPNLPLSIKGVKISTKTAVRGITVVPITIQLPGK